MRVSRAVLISLAGLLLAAPGSHGQSVFRCTVEGRIVFSDRPCNTAAPTSTPPPAAAVPAPAPQPGAAAAAPPPWQEIVRRQVMVGAGVTGTEVTFECPDRRRGRAVSPAAPPVAWTLRDGTRHPSLEAAAAAFCGAATSSPPPPPPRSPAP